MNHCFYLEDLDAEGTAGSSNLCSFLPSVYRRTVVLSRSKVECLGLYFSSAFHSQTGLEGSPILNRERRKHSFL